MPAWWNRKPHKNKDDLQQTVLVGSPKSKKSSIKSDKGIQSDKPKSFDGIFSSKWRRNSAESGQTGSSGCGSSGFSGFDSDGGERRGLPLPRPSVSSNSGFDHAVGLGYGSVSVSSVSSSGSSDEPPNLEHAQFGVSRGHDDPRLNVQSRSPGPGTRGTPASTSPLHPRLAGIGLESPTGRQEDGRSQGHPLPLPPSSPATSPPSVHPVRANYVAENTNNTFSKWKKGKLLGRGTFGHVYLGFNSEGGQMCAIKEVRIASDDQISRECYKQLNQEINLLSQLKHSNIVRYYGSELGEETLSVYLEYVSGGSIYKLLREYGPFKEPVIRNYTRQILSGLVYLHARKTVHRDIKGANILVDPNGEIKLADFGMAKHITSCTSVLSFKGSPYWMAPEVVMNTNGYSLAVDIWSLGCTILEMATSKPPWSQFEGVAAIFKIGNSKDIPDIPDHLSNEAKSFLKLCFQRDPSARPTAVQLLDHPFVHDQATMRIPNVNVTAEAFPFTFDGSHKPNALEIDSRRKSISSYDGDGSPRRAPSVSRKFRDNARMITSLPVSPCSSPLRRQGPSYRSFFLSPPHPSYGLAGQSSYEVTDYSLSPTGTNASCTFDPWHETPVFKAHTPGGSPRTRII
ncbi:hypothetical protein Nepgr_008532 [Nepenthes gracilis]|uniref:mitogen-activated protein kinase kinase kinase n=1 Tax=Nepenthes gracilis TaxID=150966 RepID=A0AAD3S9P5_NEPGR|nr:hypothetical protein Nepgr_008532 [Nepenthes gracilis]